MKQRSLFNVGTVNISGNVTINNGVGRPLLDPDQDRSEILKARFTPCEKDRVAKVCRRHRISVTDFVRESSRIGYRYLEYADILDRDDTEEFLINLFEHSAVIRSKKIQALIFQLLETVGKKF
jgi:hypothetical protein